MWIKGYLIALRRWYGFICFAFVSVTFCSQEEHTRDGVWARDGSRVQAKVYFIREGNQIHRLLCALRNPRE